MFKISPPQIMPGPAPDPACCGDEECLISEFTVDSGRVPADRHQSYKSILEFGQYFEPSFASLAESDCIIVMHQALVIDMQQEECCEASVPWQLPALAFLSSFAAGRRGNECGSCSVEHGQPLLGGEKYLQ